MLKDFSGYVAVIIGFFVASYMLEVLEPKILMSLILGYSVAVLTR